jgi:hypothetical protein
MKQVGNSRCPFNRLYISIPIALMSVAILVCVMSALFISGNLMNSKLFTNEGDLVEFTQYQFYLIVIFSLVSISAVTLGISSVWVRYRMIVVAFFLLIILPAGAFLAVGDALNDVTNASVTGL